MSSRGNLKRPGSASYHEFMSWSKKHSRRSQLATYLLLRFRSVGVVRCARLVKRPLMQARLTEQGDAQDAFTLRDHGGANDHREAATRRASTIYGLHRHRETYFSGFDWTEWSDSSVSSIVH
jgi:hypothetical protein